MRVACVLIPSFAVAVERRANPRLADQPLVVYDRNVIIDASADAVDVRRGQPLRQAKALHPQAVFVEANHALYRDVAEAMLGALEGITPLIEPAGLGIAYADIRGLQGHYEDEFALAGALVEAVRSATGLLASVGIGDGKFVSWVAASISSPGDAGIVPSGRERESLQDKDASLLPFGPNVVQRLDLLALRTLGDIAALPRAAVEAQFRSVGKQLWELANGVDRERLRPRKRQQMLSEHLSFDTPVVATETLVMASRQLVGRLVRRLRGRTARRMHIQLLADERIVWERLETFREPTGDEGRVALILKTRLSLLELPQAVDTVAVTLTGIGREVAKQAKLFTDTQQNLNQIAEAIRQLRARYGRPVVWRIAEVDPCSRHPEERSALLPYDA
jgi:nucleotidyltransferase/DNA polymerase involved in DNA repair